MEKVLFVKTVGGIWRQVLCYHGNGAPGGFVFTCFNEVQGDYQTFEHDQVLGVAWAIEDGPKGLQRP